MNVQETITRALAGDQLAYQQLYDYLWPTVRGMVGNKFYRRFPTEEDDYASDGLHAVLTHLHQYRPISSFKAWAAKVAFREITTTLRRRKASTRIPPHQLYYLDAPVTPSAKLEIVSEQMSLEGYGRLRKIWERLTPAARRVLYLHFFEGRSNPEIAEELDIHRRTAAKRIQAAIREAQLVSGY